MFLYTKIFVSYNKIVIFFTIILTPNSTFENIFLNKNWCKKERKLLIKKWCKKEIKLLIKKWCKKEIKLLIKKWCKKERKLLIKNCCNKFGVTNWCKNRNSLNMSRTRFSKRCPWNLI